METMGVSQLKMPSGPKGKKGIAILFVGLTSKGTLPTTKERVKEKEHQSPSLGDLGSFSPGSGCRSDPIRAPGLGVAGHRGEHRHHGVAHRPGGAAASVRWPSMSHSRVEFGEANGQACCLPLKKVRRKVYKSREFGQEKATLLVCH